MQDLFGLRCVLVQTILYTKTLVLQNGSTPIFQKRTEPSIVTDSPDARTQSQTWKVQHPFNKERSIFSKLLFESEKSPQKMHYVRLFAGFLIKTGTVFLSTWFLFPFKMFSQIAVSRGPKTSPKPYVYSTLV